MLRRGGEADQPSVRFKCLNEKINGAGWEMVAVVNQKPIREIVLIPLHAQVVNDSIFSITSRGLFIT